MFNKAKRQFFDTPPLRYVGAKWQIADWIIGHFPQHEVYIEPYCGSAAVFFRKHPSQLEILNDLDSDILNFFDVLRTRTDELVKAIELTPFAREEYIRALEPCDDPFERARRFYVAVWQSFGSTLIYRSGWRNQRTARQRSPLTKTWKRLDGILAAADRLKDAMIENRDALDCIQYYDSTDALFYVDPPYVLGSRADGARKRYRYEMDSEQHIALAGVLNSLDGKVILSGYDSQLYRDLYKGWKHIEKTTTTNGNTLAVEVIWLSPSAADISGLPLFDL